MKTYVRYQIVAAERGTLMGSGADTYSEAMSSAIKEANFYAMRGYSPSIVGMQEICHACDGQGKVWRKRKAIRCKECHGKPIVSTYADVTIKPDTDQVLLVEACSYPATIAGEFIGVWCRRLCTWRQGMQSRMVNREQSKREILRCIEAIRAWRSIVEEAGRKALAHGQAQRVA